MFQKCAVTNYCFGSPQNNCTMALSTTIVRFSPTPPVEPDLQSTPDLPKILDQMPPHHSKSLDPLPVQHSKSPEAPSDSALNCIRSQSECNFNCPQDRTGDFSAGCSNPKNLSEASGKQLVKVDSGYSSNLNIQHASSTVAPQSSQQWERTSSVSSSAYVGGLGMPKSYSTREFTTCPFPVLSPSILD